MVGEEKGKTGMKENEIRERERNGQTTDDRRPLKADPAKFLQGGSRAVPAGRWCGVGRHDEWGGLVPHRVDNVTVSHRQEIATW